MTTQMWLKCPDMSHDQWLAWRREGIGGSDAPVIMGDSPWSTPFQKWEEKVLNPMKEDNAAMARGRAMEPIARSMFEELMNTKLDTANVQNISSPWLRASLDGIDHFGKVMVEIKCPNREDHAIAAQYKMIPPKYYAQCQHQLAVTGLPGMYYFSFNGTEGAIVEVARDESYIQNQLFPKEKEFWDLVIAQEPPPLQERDFLNMENDPKWTILAKKWRENNQVFKAAEEADKLLRQELISLSKDRSCKGGSISLTKSITKGRIDYEQAIKDYLDNMRSHYPDVVFKDIPLEPYRKASFIKWILRGM